MESTAPSTGNHEPLKGLPPVTPPSGRFIAQLFLVPGLIVAVAVLLLLGVRSLVGGAHSAEEFLHKLDSANADIRWRGANDLAQVLLRPESLALASDPKFALDLAERLRKALDDLEQAEQSARDRLRLRLEEIDKDGRLQVSQKILLRQEARDSAWQMLEPQRSHVHYLSACLGCFTLPVGVPLLSELALKDAVPDDKGNLLRRRGAVWALGNLGENLKRFKKLTDEQKQEVRKQLQAEAAGAGRRAEWAQLTLKHLTAAEQPAILRVQASLSGFLVPPTTGGFLLIPYVFLEPLPALRVDEVLEKCADAEDPFLRELVAQALRFWDGPRIEPTLLRLTRDDGRGQHLENREMR
jgi:hypothetical protein